MLHFARVCMLSLSLMYLFERKSLEHTLELIESKRVEQNRRAEKSKHKLKTLKTRKTCRKTFHIVTAHSRINSQEKRFSLFLEWLETKNETKKTHILNRISENKTNKLIEQTAFFATRIIEVANEQADARHKGWHNGFERPVSLINLMEVLFSLRNKRSQDTLGFIIALNGAKDTIEKYYQN